MEMGYSMIFHPLPIIYLVNRKSVLHRPRKLQSNQPKGALLKQPNSSKLFFWFACLPLFCVSGLAVPKLEIRGDNWGNVETTEIKLTLITAAKLILPYSGEENWPTLRIENSVAGPMVLHQRGGAGEYTILLNTKDRRWCQYVFQFAHELGHILSDYQEDSSSIRWLEESICEVASLFVMGQMEEAWKRTSLHKQDPLYAAEFTRYFQARINMVDEIPNEEFKFWWEQRLQSLETNAIHRRTNLIIAKKLLPLFQQSPEIAWKACRTLNKNQPRSHSSFKDTIHAWLEATDEPFHKSFVLSLEKVFLP